MTSNSSINLLSIIENPSVDWYYLYCFIAPVEEETKLTTDPSDADDDGQQQKDADAVVAAAAADDGGGDDDDDDKSQSTINGSLSAGSQDSGIKYIIFVVPNFSLSKLCYAVAKFGYCHDVSFVGLSSWSVTRVPIMSLFC